MALISLGAITIVGMTLWFLTCAIERVAPLKHAKTGLAVMYGIGVLWSFGVTI